MTRRFRAGRVAIGLAGLLLIGGCGKTPKGQVLAIVNGEDITLQQVNAELQDMPVPDTLDRKLLRTTVLEGLIDRQLQVAEARRLKIDETPEYAALKKRNEENLLAGLIGHKVALTVPLPADRDIRDYIQGHPLQFAKRERLTLDQLSFAAPKDSRRLAALAQAHSLDAAGAMLQAMGIAATRGQGQIDTGQTEPDVARQLVQAPAGEPVLLPQGDRLVIGVITAREPIALTPSENTVAAARALRGADLLHESEAQIAQARSKAKIEYAAGFAPDKVVAKR